MKQNSLKARVKFTLLNFGGREDTVHDSDVFTVHSVFLFYKKWPGPKNGIIYFLIEWTWRRLMCMASAERYQRLVEAYASCRDAYTIVNYVQHVYIHKQPQPSIFLQRIYFEPKFRQNVFRKRKKKVFRRLFLHQLLERRLCYWQFAMPTVWGVGRTNRRLSEAS